MSGGELGREEVAEGEDVLVGVLHRGHQHPTARPWEKQHAESPMNTPSRTGAVGGVRNPGDSARRREARSVRPTSYAELTREAH